MAGNNQQSPLKLDTLTNALTELYGPNLRDHAQIAAQQNNLEVIKEKPVFATRQLNNREKRSNPSIVPKSIPQRNLRARVRSPVG